MGGAFDVYLRVISRALDGWAHTGHGSEVQNRIRLEAGDQAGNGRPVGDVHFLDVNFGGFEIRLFPAAVIENTKNIHAEDGIAGGAQPLRPLKANKTRPPRPHNPPPGPKVSFSARSRIGVI